MHRTRFMSWLFLVLASGFFLVRDFRFALEAPLANFSWRGEIPSRLARLYSLERYVSAGKLRSLAEEAARRGDSKFVAFAALNLSVKEAKADAMRLADKAVQADPGLTWIYYPVATRLAAEEGWDHLSLDARTFIQARTAKLQAFDPDNAVPHLLRAELIQASRSKSWPYSKKSPIEPEYLDALAKETEWGMEMEAAFASPRYDDYTVRQFDLCRRVMRERRWDHPAVMATVWANMPAPKMFRIRDYMNLLVQKFGAEAEAAGHWDQAFNYYWQAAQFVNRLPLKWRWFIERLVAQKDQLSPYGRPAAAFRKAGKEQEAKVLEYLDKQSVEELSRTKSPLAWSSNYTWSVLLVRLSAMLVAVFLPITLISVVYVNAKLWVRKEKKGRLYQVLTRVENYLPVLLFLSCLALYLSFVPFGLNYAFYMSTDEKFSRIPEEFLVYTYPNWSFYSSSYSSSSRALDLPNPFQDYLPYALSGIVLLAAAVAFPRLRRARIEAASAEDRLSIRYRQVNTAISLFIALTGAAVVAGRSPPDYRPFILEENAAFFVFVAFVALLFWDTLQASSSYARRSRTPERSPRGTRAIEIGAYLLLLVMAAIAGLMGGWLGDFFGKVLSRVRPPEWDELGAALALTPFVLAGAVAAARMRFRRVTLALFLLTPLAVMSWKAFDEFSSHLKSSRASEHLKRLKKGEELYNRRDWVDAIREYREAVRLNPDSSDAHISLGAALHRNGDWDGAFREYRKAVGAGQDDAAAHNNFGIALGYKGDLDGAIREYRKTVGKMDDALAHIYFGGDLRRKGDRDGEIQEYREAIRLEPDSGAAHNNLGRAHERKGDRRAALDEYRKASELDPKSPDFRANYERLRKQLKK